MPKQTNFLAKSTSAITKLFTKSATAPAVKDPIGMSFDRDVLDWFGHQESKIIKRPSRISYKMLRQLARTLPVVGVCKNTLKHQITKVRWDLVPIDKQKPNPEHVDKVFRLLSHPNRNRESFRTLLDKVIDDILDLDAGILEKVRNRQGEIVELWHRDAANIIPCFDTHGIAADPAYIQILEPNPEPVATWSNEDMIFMMQNPQGSSQNYGFGMSPVEVAVTAITSNLMIENYNSSYFDKNTIPPAIINLGEGYTNDQIKKFRAAWIQQLQGTSNQWNNPIVNSKTLDVKLLRSSNSDMQYAEYQLYLLKIIVAAFEMSPQDIGFTMDINRANGEVQANLSKNKGLMSLLSLIREYINNEIIYDFGFDREFSFEWLDVNQQDELVQAQIDKIYVDSGIDTRNEVRARRGEEPVIGGERLSVNTAAGPVYLDTTPLDGLSDTEIAEMRTVEEEDPNGDTDKELDSKGSPKDKKADPKTVATANNSKDDKVDQGNMDRKAKKSLSKKKSLLTPAIHEKQQAIEEKIQKLIQKRYQKLADYYTKSLSKTQDEADDPDTDIDVTDYIDPKTNQPKKEYFLIPLLFFEETYSLGRENAIKAWSVQNGSSELRQKDVDKITKMRNEAASGVHKRRTEGIQKILDNNKLSDEEKRDKINNYLGVAKNQDNFELPSSAYAAHEMQTALVAGTVSAIKQLTTAKKVSIVNSYGPKDDYCINMVQNSPYTLEEAEKLLEDSHNFCRCTLGKA